MILGAGAVQTTRFDSSPRQFIGSDGKIIPCVREF